MRKGRGREYFLTPAGEELRPVIEGLGEWGQRWRFYLASVSLGGEARRTASSGLSP